LSKLFVANKVPAEYIRSVIQEIVRGIEDYTNTNVAKKKVGTFTCAADDVTTVNDIAVLSDSTILLMPTNAAAAALMAGSSALYVSARTAGASFAVTTADAGNAVGTETFQYIVLN
jgi:hypothetical protein